MAVIVIILLAFIIGSSFLSKYDNAAGRAAGAALAAVQKPFVMGVDWLVEKVETAFTDDALRAENEALAAEVERLEGDLSSARLDEAELEELRQLRDATGAAAAHGEYALLTAGILSYEGANIYNVFTIDAGTEDGVLRDTVAVARGGLVGRVLEANANSSKVAAIIDESNRIGFQIEGKQTELGVCYGNGRGWLDGEMLDDQADVREGDRVLTSGLGGIYPAGILVGTVVSAEFVKESSLLHLEIEPAVDFKSVRKVALLL